MKFKCVIRGLLLLLMCSTVPHVYASCTYMGSFDIYANLGKIVVQKDAPLGVAFYSKTVSTPSYNFAYCSNTWYLELAMDYNGAVRTAYPGVYATTVPGIGIKVEWNVAGLGYATYENPPSRVYGSGDVYLKTGGSVRVSLVRTGNITGGTLTIGTIGSLFIDTYQNTIVSLSLTTSSAVTVTSCDILGSRNLVFPIGNISVAEFGTTVGTVPQSATSSQNILLNCLAGANVNLELSGAQNFDLNDPTVLALDGQGGEDIARGVGVQILNNGVPLQLNRKIVFKTSTGGQEIIPITARYIQTKTAVSTGKANSTATLNITYQ